MKLLRNIEKFSILSKNILRSKYLFFRLHISSLILKLIKILKVMFFINKIYIENRSIYLLVTLIKEITILSNTGVPIFCHNFCEEIDERHNYQLISSYFYQISQFAQYGFKENINTLKMDKCVFYFYTHALSKYQIILKCDKKIDEKRSRKKTVDLLVHQIFTKFFTRFEKELLNFKGNITPFKKFSKDIERIIPKSMISRPIQASQ